MTLSDSQIARICRGLAMLLHSGIGAAEGLFLLIREEPELRPLLESLAEEMDKGLPLSDAVADSRAFPQHVGYMIAVGEETGRLEEALDSLARDFETRIHTRQQLRSAIAYPCMVLALMLLVIGVLLVKVLPVFDRVYASLGSRLTGIGAGLLYAGQLLKEALPAVFVLLLALALAAAALYLCPKLRKKLTAALHSRYADRGIARKFHNARFARALSMGLSSGLSLEDSLNLARTLLADAPGAAGRCEQCSQALKAGRDFPEAAEAAQLLPASHCRMLGLGIRSGNTDLILERIARDMTDDAWSSLERAIGRIEPALVVVSSLLVGLILLSVMLPLADILLVLE